jgi:hypothetical protein
MHPMRMKMVAAGCWHRCWNELKSVLQACSACQVQLLTSCHSPHLRSVGARGDGEMYADHCADSSLCSQERERWQAITADIMVMRACGGGWSPDGRGEEGWEHASSPHVFQPTPLLPLQPGICLS